MLRSTTETTARVFLLLSETQQTDFYEKAFGKVGIGCRRLDISLSENAFEVEKPYAVLVDLDLIEKAPALKKKLLFILGTHEAAQCDFPWIAVSSRHDTSLIQTCLQSGFSEVLSKTAPGDQLIASVMQCKQRKDFLQRLKLSHKAWTHMLAQISAGPTLAHVRLATLHALHRLLGCRAASWLNANNEMPFRERVTCAIPRNISELNPPMELFALLNGEGSFEHGGTTFSLGQGSQSQFLLCRTSSDKEVLIFWGLRRTPSQSVLQKISIILQHGEMALLNLKLSEALRAQTCLDDLTGLWNLRALRNDLQALTSGHPFEQDKFSVVFVDVDRLKAVNDQYGHLVGSECLVTVGQILSQSVRNTDSVYRYGGDEFIVVLRNTEAKNALIVCERIRRNIEIHKFSVGPFSLRLTVSVGLAGFPDHATDPDSLLRLADEAMYHAKKKTKNAVYVAKRSTEPVAAAAAR